MFEKKSHIKERNFINKLKKISFVMGVLIHFKTTVFAQSESSSVRSQDVGSVRTSASNQDENQRGKFGVTYYFLGGQTYYTENRYSNLEFYDSYISFNYKANRDLRFAARPAFAYSVANTGKYGNPEYTTSKEVNDVARNRDFSFVMTSYNTLEDYLPVDLAYKLQFRYYIPTSEGSKEQGQIGRLQVENELKQKFWKYSNIRFYAKPAYYFQKNKTYLAANGKQFTTTDVDSEHGIELSYSLSKMFAIKPGLNFKDRWEHKSEFSESTRNPHRSTLDYRLGLEVNLSKVFGFTLGGQLQQDLINTKNAEEWSWSVLASGVMF